MTSWLQELYQMATNDLVFLVVIYTTVSRLSIDCWHNNALVVLT